MGNANLQSLIPCPDRSCPEPDCDRTQDAAFQGSEISQSAQQATRAEKRLYSGGHNKESRVMAGKFTSGFDVAIALALLVMCISSAKSVAGHIYPSQTSWNEASILDRDTWALFWSVGGFSNTPNASVSDINGSNVSIEWNGSLSHTHQAVLSTSWDSDVGRQVAILYRERDEFGTEIVNKTLSTTSFGIYNMSDYYLTAFTETNGVTHIFWEKSYKPWDVPWRYWMYHESVDKNGSILASAELFYYEVMQDSWWSNPLLWLVALPLLLILLVALLAVFLLRRRRTREKPTENTTTTENASLKR